MNNTFKKQKILIIDDVPENIKVIVHILKNDYILAVSTNGPDALKLVACETPDSTLPDLILLDIMMPGMDGYEVCRRLKLDEKTKNIPIIFVTALNSTEDETKGFELGAVDFISKPFSHVIIEARIKGVLERERMARDLDLANRYVQSMLDSSMHMIVSLDSKLSIIRFNKTAENLFGYQESEIQGQGIEVLFSDPSDVEKLFESLDNTGQFIGEVSTCRKNGEHFPSSLTTTFLRDEKEKIIGTLNTFRNISEEVALRKARETAERSKSAFLANMTHELRSPVNAITSIASWLLTTSLTEGQQTMLESALQSSNTLRKLLDNVLDYSKLAAGRLELEHVGFDFHKTLENVCTSLSSPIFSKGVVFIADISPDIPKNLLGDEMWLGRVIENLVGNATKFTHQGEIILKVWRELELDPSKDNLIYLHFSISDSGIGIPLQKHQEVFEHFTQADVSTTRNYGGTGLGLAICKELVALMGGCIWVESTPNKGSTFHFIAHFGLDSMASGEISSKPLSALDGVRILVADVHPLNRQIIRETLASCGCLVSDVATGEELLKEIKDARQSDTGFQIMLVDGELPDPTDGTLAERLDADLDPSTPLVLMQHLQSKLDKHLRDRGREDFSTLLKPLLRSTLISKIETVLNKTDRSEKPASVVDTANNKQPNDVQPSEAPSNHRIDLPKLSDASSKQEIPDCRDPVLPISVCIDSVRALRASIRTRDALLVKQQAQVLKDYAGTIKVVPLKNAAFKMVLAARAQDWDQIEQAFAIVLEHVLGPGSPIVANNNP